MAIIKRYYGTSQLTWYGDTAYPATSSSFNRSSQLGGDRALIEHFSTYTKCFFDITAVGESTTVAESQYTWKRLTFHDIGHLVSWINQNIPNAGGFFTHSCVIKVYDEVNTEAPGIYKVYGKNSILARLRGKWYFGGKPFANSGTDWTAATAFLEYIWDDIYGTALPAGTPEERFGCFWMSANAKRLYTAPKRENVYITFSNGVNNGRYYYSTLPPGFNLVSALSGPWQSPSSPVGGTFSAPISTGASFDGLKTYSPKALRLFALDNSLVAALPLEGVPNSMAILLHPLGVDSLWFNDFDSDTYELEAVSSRDSQSSWTRISPIDMAGAQCLARLSSYGPIHPSQWMGGLSKLYPASLMGGGRVYPAPIRFQLRHKKTRQVSALSIPRIKWQFRRGQGLLGPIVESSPTY